MKKDKKNKKKPVFTYYRFHVLVFTESLLPIIIYVMYRTGFLHSYDKLSLLFSIAGYYGGSAYIYKRFFTIEKKDELVQFNMARANKFTLYAAAAVLFAGVLLNDYVCKGLISSDFCFILVSAAIALRSLIFMLSESPDSGY